MCLYIWQHGEESLEKFPNKLNSSPWAWGHVGIKLGTKHVTQKKLVNFM